MFDPKLRVFLDVKRRMVCITEVCKSGTQIFPVLLWSRNAEYLLNNNI